MNGCTASGKRWAEKKTPERIHIGIITEIHDAGDGLDGSRARGDK